MLNENLPISRIAQLHPAITLKRFNEIDVLVVRYGPVGEAMVSLQGAQLLRWRPKHARQDVVWISDEEPFIAGRAIRGGVPICYPWFGKPRPGLVAHGTARLLPWQLDNWAVGAKSVMLLFGLYNDEQELQASMAMTFDKECRLTFVHHGEDEVQVALHSYFEVATLDDTQLSSLPPTCFDALTQQEVTVPLPRKITGETDCIYAAQRPLTHIHDHENMRTITLLHRDASEVVLWNPWHNTPSAMAPDAYEHMLCLETARLSDPLLKNEAVTVEIAVFYSYPFLYIPAVEEEKKRLRKEREKAEKEAAAKAAAEKEAAEKESVAKPAVENAAAAKDKLE